MNSEWKFEKTLSIFVVTAICVQMAKADGLASWVVVASADTVKTMFGSVYTEDCR